MKDLAALSEESRECALTRYRLLAPHLEGERTLRSVAEEAGVSLRTAQRWVDRYRKSGLVGLTRRERADDGRRRAVTPRLLETIEGLALEKPPLPISSIYRQIKLFAVSLGESVPSYSVVCRIVRKLPPSLLMLAHQGNKVYRESFDLVYRREATRSNAI